MISSLTEAVGNALPLARLLSFGKKAILENDGTPANDKHIQYTLMIATLMITTFSTL